MRFGLLIYDSLDFTSGGYIYNRNLVDELRSRGHEVEIVARPYRNYLSHLRDNFSKLFSDSVLSLDVDLLLQDELNHPSLVAVNSRIREQRDYPIISIVHHLRKSEKHPVPFRGFYTWVEKKYLNSVDGFVFNSETTKNSVEGLMGFGSPHIVAQPAGDRLRSKHSSADIKIRSKQKGPLKVAFVGNLIRRKATHLILEALTMLQSGSVHLSIAGSLEMDPRYVEQIRRLISQHELSQQVEILGYLNEEKLTSLLQSSHVMAVPSSYEGYGIVYLEGMGFGLPAIGTLAGAAGEIITNNVDGFLIKTGSAEQLAERFGQLHEDRARLLEMSLAAVERYQRHPSWQLSMARAANFLERTIIEHKP